MDSSSYEDNFDEETRRSLRQESRNICKTMCFGSFIFLLTLAGATIIIVVVASTSSRPHISPDAIAYEPDQMNFDNIFYQDAQARMAEKAIARGEPIGKDFKGGRNSYKKLVKDHSHL
ncbi:hypothetical protein RB195_016618 [Necator americanus]|uniref:Uncharacterized protein n=1 Tax=Necator americanus TaxID=51031 RepID=A0ABR1C519_NECAM